MSLYVENVFNRESDKIIKSKLPIIEREEGGGFRFNGRNAKVNNQIKVRDISSL